MAFPLGSFPGSQKAQERGFFNGLLALAILALVVATVLAMGPVRVWDMLTLRMVEEYWPNGQIQRRYYLRLWDSQEKDDWPWVLAPTYADYDQWYENGQKEAEIRHSPVQSLRGWAETGIVTSYVVRGVGIQTTDASPTGAPVEQYRFEDGQIVEIRTSPPWFTEEEILQSVEGVEE